MKRIQVIVTDLESGIREYEIDVPRFAPVALNFVTLEVMESEPETLQSGPPLFKRASRVDAIRLEFDGTPTAKEPGSDLFTMTTRHPTEKR